MVILVPLLLLLIISFELSFVSQISQIFGNNIVKNGWDLVNVVLVLFAILCGVVGKLSDDKTQLIEHEVVIHTSTVSDQIKTNKETSILAIFDEFDSTTNNNPPPTSQIVQSGLNEVESDDCNIKVIPVDTCVLGPAQSSAKAPKPPSNPAKSRPRRLPESISPAEKHHEFVKIQSPTLPRPTVAGKEIATVVASLYKQAKRKTKHATTHKNHKNIKSQPPTEVAASSRPPASVFHNMFRKATRTKRIHSEASVAPPRSSSLGVQNKLFDSKPPLPKKVQSKYFNNKKSVNVGSNKSQEFRVPLQMNRARAEVAFENPEIGNAEEWSTIGLHDLREGNQSGGEVLCPSPDVNVKADRFIARLRGEWNLDQMDS